MKKTYSMLVSVLCFIVAGSVLTACDNDDEGSNSGEVILLSFGPSGVAHGEEISFIGQNLTKVDAIKLGDATIQNSEFVEQTSGQIRLVVPVQATKGKAVLMTSDGEIESKTEISFDVPISITSFSPSEIRAGEELTFTGEFLNWVREVHFYNGVVVTDFVSQSLNELVVIVPIEAQTGIVILSDGELINDPILVETEEELIVGLPEVYGMSPVPLKHTEELTISGVNMDLVQEIIFPGGAVVSNFNSQSTEEIKLPVPATSLNGPLTLIAFSGIEIVSADELNIILPVATAFNPNPVDPLAELTISGTDLDMVKEVIFSGDFLVVSENFNAQSATEIKLDVPEGVLKGILTFITIHDFQTTTSMQLEITGGLPPLQPLGLAVFDDNYQNGFGNWGYGGPSEVVNTIVREGDFSMKKTFDGSWDAVRFGQDAPGLSASGFTKLVFSVFGGPGTNGLNMNLIVNDNWGASVITVVEGEWTEYSINLSDLGSPTELAGTGLQAHGWSGAIYVDHVGLR
jgi:hypothetical protein